MLYNIIVLKPFLIFCVTCDRYMTVTCDITLTLNSKFKNKKIKKNEMKIN